MINTDMTYSLHQEGFSIWPSAELIVLGVNRPGMENDGKLGQGTPMTVIYSN